MTKNCVVLGVTGSIAAYKACDVVSRLRKQNVDVHVILTRAGAEIITPLALETMSANPVVVDMFPPGNALGGGAYRACKTRGCVFGCPRNGEFSGQSSAWHCG